MSLRPFFTCYKKNIKIHLLFCLCLVTAPLFGSRTIATTIPSCACDPTVDSLAMVDLYTATNGENWWGIQWDLTQPFQTWAGLTFNESGCLIKLILNNRNLIGPIPASLGNVEALDTLSLTNNQLTGNLPVALGLLLNLTYVGLNNNELTGAIPSAFINMPQLGTFDLSNNALTGIIPEITTETSNLERLWLFNNFLEGSIPNSIGNLNNLVNFNASVNNLLGNLPSTIGNLTNLIALNLAYNELTGALPNELGNLTNLTHLRLESNQLTGTIPSALGDLSTLIRLNLDYNQLTGDIPASLGNLDDLTQLYLNNNTLSGAIPNRLYNLTNLTIFNLSYNQLSGNLSNRLSRLTQLTRIDLHDNQFDGSIPSNIGNMTNLDQIYLHNNNLSGSIPPNFFNLTNLFQFNLSNNQLSGNIPNELGNLIYLQRIELHNNQLNGTIPSSIGNLTNLDQIYLHNNNLSGSIPISLFNLTNLLQLSLSNNQLSGNIPNELGNLIQLYRIDLDSNQLDGVIPSSIGKLTNVDQIYLHHNNLSGTIPDSLFYLTNLIQLNLSNNQLSGNIPYELGNLTQLHRIDLHDNQLEGSIPNSISNLTNVDQIYLHNNNLSGAIPASIGSMMALANLNLRNNQLEGTIPSELGNLISLRQLRLDSNQLSGTIPVELSNLFALTNLILSNNQLTGEIPSSLGSLVNLFQLFLSHNQLTGTIPSELSNLATLFNLGLHNNQLSGHIPAALGNLSSLREANLSANQLEGTIPTTFGGLGNLEELYLFRNKLTGNIPTQLGQLGNLRDLNLSYNQLSGIIPPELASLNKLVRLELYVNHLEGTIPDFSSLPAIEVIDLCCQKIGLSGEIPLSLTTRKTLKELRLHINQLSGEIPDSLGSLPNLTHLNLSNNQLTGCIPTTFFDFCDKEIQLQLDNNPFLLAGDDFTTFCNTGEGACLANYECGDAITLPMNESPCGRSYIAVKLNEASTSSPSPELSCNTTFVGNDLWFKVIVPTTGNFLIKNDSLSNIATSIEAYEGSCGNMTAIACAELDSLPFVLSIENRSEGETIYFRVWDQNNSIVNTNPDAVVALSVHQLAANKDEWALCDFPINLLDDTMTIGAGIRVATQFIIQFDSTATALDKADVENELISQNATLVYECPCQDQNQALQLWSTENPIEMEERGRTSKSKSKIDTSNYNYFLEDKDIQLFTGTINVQDKSAVAIDEQGNFIMAWQDLGRDGEYLGVFAQRFQSNGTPLGADFQMNTTTYFNQELPRLAIQSDGDFLGVWMSRISNDGVAGQRYKADGTKDGTETRISDALIGQFPDIAMDATGNYVVVYDYLDESGLGIYAEQFNADGTPMDDFFQVNTKYTHQAQQFPSVAMNNTGKYVVTWQSFDTLTNNFEVLATLYDANADTIKAEFIVNTEMNEDQRFPKVAMNDLGTFVITWQSFGQDGSDNGVYAQTFDAQGAKIGSETRINTITTGSQSKPKVTIYEDGDYFVVWEDFSTNNTDIFGQLMSNTNQPIGAPIVINAITEGNQSNPDIAMNSAGQIIISWESFNQNGNTQGIFGQRFNTTGTGTARVVTPLDNTTLTAGLGQIHPYAAENYTPTNATNKVRVAISDTGVSDDHGAIMNALWLNPNNGQSCVDGDIGYDFVNKDGEPNDIDGHGTSVNGTITNGFPNDIQLELINAKFYENSRGSVFDAICGIYYAVNEGAKVINLSWGFESEEYPKILYDALIYAAEKDVLIITSAGNTSKNNDVAKKYPANLDIPTMIVVTAYQVDGDGNNPRLSSYSSYGTTSVDIAALGYAEVPDFTNDTLKTSFGTSLAAPLVARTAAIIKGRFPFLTAADIKDCILSTAEFTVALNGLIATNGILDEAAAVLCATQKVEVITNGDCQNDFNLDDNPVPNGNYHAETNIVSASLVAENSTVIFQAEESITLLPGFHAVAGADFHALIDNCENAVLLPDTTVFNTAKIVNSTPPAAATTLTIFPNPTTNYLTTRFSLPESGTVQLQIFDTNGTLLKAINNRQLDKGWYEESIDVSTFVSGVYIVQLRSHSETLTQKLVIQRP